MNEERYHDSITPSSLRARRKPIPLTLEQRREKQRLFLEAYAECGVIKYACRFARINRSTVRYWLEHDKDFQDVFPESKEDACDTLEYAAYQQAVEGTEEPAVSMGKLVYEEIPILDAQNNPLLDEKGKPLTKRGKLVMIKKYSPQLLITLLKGNKPEKYKDRVTQEHVGEGGGPIKYQIDYSKLTNEELAMLERMAQKVDNGEN